MQPRCRQVPPTLSRSTMAIESPAAAPYSAVAYPPGPPPMTTTSNSGVSLVVTTTSWVGRTPFVAVRRSPGQAGSDGRRQPTVAPGPKNRSGRGGSGGRRARRAVAPPTQLLQAHRHERGHRLPRVERPVGVRGACQCPVLVVG